MNTPLLRLLGCSAALLLAGCAASTSPAELQAAEHAAARSDGRYRIGPGDFLLITFFGEPDYTQQVRVDSNGQISLPFLAGSGKAEIQAKGLSAAQLAERINQYAQKNQILQNARAQVVVAEFANQTFVLLGQVNQPGRYAFPRGIDARIDIKDAIALGGGFTRLARQSEVVVKRGARVYRLDLRKLSTQAGPGSFTVLPGDAITVEERLF
jgi:protein involved in polysaccharide export with SLBB domain